MPVLPRKQELILSERFEFGGGDFPTDLWDNSANAFTAFSEQYIESIGIGELIYTGISLHLLALTSNSSDADFVIGVGFFGSEKLKCTIRGRRQDENNYIGLSIDFESDLVTLVQATGGVELTLASANHDFKFDMLRSYLVELWMEGENLYGSINGFNIVSATSSQLNINPGFSLYVPQVADDPAIFRSLRVYNTAPQEARSLENSNSLLTQFRKNIQQLSHNPTERTWASYKLAKTHYDRNRNIGMSDSEWERFGYPLQEPSAEEWFGT